MDSHQVEGQQGCASATTERPWTTGVNHHRGSASWRCLVLTLAATSRPSLPTRNSRRGAPTNGSFPATNLNRSLAGPSPLTFATGSRLVSRPCPCSWRQQLAASEGGVPAQHPTTATAITRRIGVLGSVARRVGRDAPCTVQEPSFPKGMHFRPPAINARRLLKPEEELPATLGELIARTAAKAGGVGIGSIGAGPETSFIVQRSDGGQRSP
jgi:hypothetical protein